MKIKVPDGTLRKTISIGVSEFPKDTESFWQGIKFADVALYKAKETGRNKVVRFTKEMWTTEEF
jgi:diguanylate cyclase (GGDEF)-like protein